MHDPAEARARALEGQQRGVPEYQPSAAERDAQRARTRLAEDATYSIGRYLTEGAA